MAVVEGEARAGPFSGRALRYVTDHRSESRAHSARSGLGLPAPSGRRAEFAVMLRSATLLGGTRHHAVNPGTGALVRCDGACLVRLPVARAVLIQGFGGPGGD